jgi:hypothetical protein
VTGVFAFSFFKPSLHLAPPVVVTRPDFEFKGVQILQYVGDHLELNLDAKRATFQRDDSYVTLSDVNGLFYSTGTAPIEMASPSVSVSIGGAVLTMMNARLRFKLDTVPAELTTTRLEWDNRTQTLVGEDSVVIHSPKYHMSGRHFKARIPLMTFTLDTHAKAVFTP